MSNRITWPLMSNVIRGNSVNNTFGYVRKYANGNAKPHQGWDFTAAVGDPLWAVGAGKVIFVRNRGDYGMQLCHSLTFNGKTYYAFYAHLASVIVSTGDLVEPDTYLGTNGKSGNAKNLAAKELHLHFEVRTIAEPGLGLGGRVSPFTIFGKCPLHNAIPG